MSRVTSYLKSVPEPFENFTQVYVSHMPYVLSYFQAYSIDSQQAEDLAQEVFIKVFLHREQLPDIKNIRGWLKVIARNTYVDFLRKDRLQTLPLDAVCYTSETPWLQEETMEESLAQSELQCEICRLFSDPLQRKILYGTICGIAPSELADMLHIPAGTVRSQLYRMRKKLKAELKDVS